MARQDWRSPLVLEAALAAHAEHGPVPVTHLGVVQDLQQRLVRARVDGC